MRSKICFSLIGAYLMISLYVSYSEAQGCPSKCFCQQGTFRCSRVRLDAVPDIPRNTTVLDLKLNNIVDITKENFDGLRQVHSIFLSENRIRELKEKVFSGAPNLRNLYINQNQIQSVHSTAFENLARLERLFLHGNQIQNLHHGTFNALSSLRFLRLDSNPLDCNCGLMWLVKYLKSKRQNLNNFSANCKTPNRIEGLRLIDVNESEFPCKKPEIVENPSDLTVDYGEVAEFQCIAVGDPSPYVDWMFNSNKIDATDSRISMTNNGKLKIENAEMSDQGLYSCVASNSMGETISVEARMSVVPQDHQTSHDQVIYDFDDDWIMIDCGHPVNPRNSFTWLHNGVNLSGDSDHIQIHENGSLVIHNPIEDDEGDYSCKNGDSIVSNHKLIAPLILEALENKRINVGDNVMLTCNAAGFPVPFITWTKNENVLEFTNRIHLSDDNKSLKVDFVKETDSGVYKCIAESILGSDESSAQIDIINSRGVPVIVVEPYDLEAVPGTTIELPCASEDDPPPISKWKKDGKTLTKSPKYNLSPSGSLFISNINEADAGRYECSLNNEFGRSTASCVVTVSKREILAPAQGDKFFRAAFSLATNEVDLRINETISMMFQKPMDNPQQHQKSYGDLFKMVRFPTGAARELARASEIYERTLVNIRRQINAGKILSVNISSNFDYDDVLSTEYLELLEQLSDCAAHRITQNCSDMCFHSKYRTIDGSCNNLRHSLWGSSLSAFRRLIPAIYENGFNSPIGWDKQRKYNGFSLPSARLVSTSLISTDVIEQDSQITHMVMQWGQFLDHDMDHALPAVSAESWDGVDCKKTCDYAPPCYPIEVPSDDERVKNRRCIDFIRSSSTCGSGMTSVFFEKLQPREQINQLTSFIDASQVYGYSQQFSRDLRNITLEGEDHGYLRVGVQFANQKPMLPFAAPTDGIDCRRNLDESSINCFTAGDIRVNEQVGLLSMHVIWMREHNRIVELFNQMNPHWTGEQIYQEARKIVGAQMQHITYKHWLPYIIGEEGMEIMGSYQGYDSSINPSISNEFATAALRFGHSLINPILHRLDWNFEEIKQGHLPLHQAFFAPWRVVYEGGIDPLLRGLFTVAAKLKKPDQNLNSDLTERLFTTFHAVSLDLAAMNIQRGRDHAIPSYMEYRKLCNLSISTSFESLSDISSLEVKNKLKTVYGHVDNIDLWVGGILEDQLPGARVGPLFRCILVEQFKKLRDGDRFYYENPSIFKPDQLTEIKQSTLSRVLCDNGDNITRVTEDVFLLPNLQNGYKKCEDIKEMTLKLWMDCNDCNTRSAYNLDISQLPTRNRFRRDVNVNDEENVTDERIEKLQQLVENLQKSMKQMEEEIQRLKNLSLKIN